MAKRSAKKVVTDLAGLSEERRLIARDASFELESILGMLIEQCEDDPEVDSLRVRGIAIRARQLSCVVMSAVDDEVHKPADLRARITGVREAAHG